MGSSGSLSQTFEQTKTNHRDYTMSLDTYTRYLPLTKKAQFWGTYVSALKGSADLCAAPEPRITHHYPSITETLPAYPGFRHEFGKLENLMWRGRRGNSAPPTRVLPEANDRIHSIGYNYLPVHTDIYGSYRNRDARRGFY